MTAPSMERRLRQRRSRVLVREWKYRQRAHADGAWYRLRRVLADAREAWSVSPEDARAIAAEGNPAERVGSELAPPKLIVRAPAARVALAPSARRLDVRLSAELLAAEGLVLVPFPCDGAAGTDSPTALPARRDTK